MAGQEHIKAGVTTMNRFFTRSELATEYRHPLHVLEQLLAEIAPVEKNNQGEPLFLDAHVDAWLNDQYAAIPGRRRGEDFLTIREVAQLLRCSYSEARDRMLDGRIKTIKDGRWLRTSREWVEQYVAAKTIQQPDPEVVEIPRPRGRRDASAGFKLKKNGAGYRFLKERAENARKG
jgi:excisionase family DNA binding protein